MEFPVAQLCRMLARLQPLGLRPGWRFGTDLERPRRLAKLRQAVWSLCVALKWSPQVTLRWHYGLRFRLHLGNDLSRLLFVGGCVDPNEFYLLDQILRPGMSFLDAGANEGLYTLFAAAKVGPSGRVYCFEPSQREFDRLQDNIRLNRLDWVESFRLALGDHPGQATLHVADFRHSGHNTLGSFRYPQVRRAACQPVEVVRLDDLCAEGKLGRVDVWKLDVEGSELAALRGGGSLLSSQRPILLFECSDGALRGCGADLAALQSFLEQSEYCLYRFDPGAGHPVAVATLPDEENVIAIPQGSRVPWPPGGAAVSASRA